MKAVFLTAGAAGMYCGSCMHDNALARALRSRDVDCVLQPIYTPIRTDQPSVANERVFYGGIQIYLLQQMPWLRWLPSPLRRPLDWPPLVRFATRRAGATDAGKLGALAVSMLEGAEGRQADEAERLVKWLCDEMRPDAIILTNLLIGGALPEIRRRLHKTRIVVILQGDDIFLDHLPADARTKSIELCRELIQHVDHIVVNSRFYGNKMGTLFDIPQDKLVCMPLSIDLEPFKYANTEPMREASDTFRLGYLARVAPEKGLHLLVDAFIRLAADPRHADLTLEVAGWLGTANQAYLQSLRDQIDQAGLGDRFTYHGSPGLEQKVEFLRSLDLLSVPTEYEEPKGLFVLEAAAAGVPVVQPDHGAFAEMIESTGGGLLVPPHDVAALCQAIERLKNNSALRLELAQRGKRNVATKHSIEAAAESMQRLVE